MKTLTMKYFSVVTGLAFLLFTVISCKKTSIQTNQLLGQWSIVNDSTSTDDFCSGCFNGSNYIGKESDYYTFNNDATLYIEESGATDTATYTIMTNNQINIAANYAVNGGGVFDYSLFRTGGLLPLSYSIKNLIYSISNMTEHTLTLYTSGTATMTGEPAIKYIEIINLKR